MYNISQLCEESEIRWPKSSKTFKIPRSFRCWWSHYSSGHAASYGCCHLPGAGRDSWEEKWWGGTTQNTCNSFQVSVSSYDMQLSCLTTIGSYWISALAMAFLKSAGCGRSFGRIGWSRCWTLGTGCSGHWAWSSSSDRCPIVLRDQSNKTWKSHDACSWFRMNIMHSSIVHWLLQSVQLTKPLKMDDWKTVFLLGSSIFRGYISFREGISLNEYSIQFN